MSNSRQARILERGKTSGRRGLCLMSMASPNSCSGFAKDRTLDTAQMQASRQNQKRVFFLLDHETHCLLGAARADDNSEAIRKRLATFKEESSW